MSRTISLTVSDSVMNAHVAVPKGEGPFPGIIILHDAFGVNADIRNTADKLAKEGFVAIAPELFHRSAQPGFEARYYQVSMVMPHVNALKQEQLTQDMQAAHKWLKAQENVIDNKIGVLGFSLGGKFSFIANSALKLSAGVSFYGGQLHKELNRISNMDAPHLFIWAGKDEYISREQRDTVMNAMRDADKDFTNIDISRAGHGFFFDGQPGYNRHAANESWGLVKEFFKNKLN